MSVAGRDIAGDGIRAVVLLVLGVVLLVAVPEVASSWGQDGVPATDPVTWATPVALVAACAMVVPRQSRPVLAFAVGSVAVVAGSVVQGSTHIALTLVFAELLYSAVLYSSRRASGIITAVVAVLIVALGVLSLATDGARAAVLVVLNLSLAAIPVAWGREVRHHREDAVAHRQRAAQDRRVAELDRAAAVAAERARMARDLHDVIAGQLSAIAIQSEAALTVPDATPATLRRVLASVRRDSVASLAEMRTMIGLLRADGAADGEPLTAPAGLDRLDTLLEASRATGLRIELDDGRGAGSVLPAATDLAAYRIVQEALTNAAKHAPRSAVRVALRHERDELTVRVENDLVPAARGGGGTGTGIAGLRERAGAVGGRVEAGRQDRAWVLRAVLPLGAPPLDAPPLGAPQPAPALEEPVP